MRAGQVLLDHTAGMTCLSVRLSVCLSVCLSMCPSVCLCVYSEDRALLEDSKLFTVLIKNYVEFPKFAKKRYVTLRYVTLRYVMSTALFGV